MDSNHKNLQDKLNRSPQIPDELQWEHMEDGIYSKMDEINHQDADRKNRRILFLLFLSFAALLLAFAFLYQESSTENNATSLAITPSDPLSQPDEQLLKSNELNTPESDLDIKRKKESENTFTPSFGALQSKEINLDKTPENSQANHSSPYSTAQARHKAPDIHSSQLLPEEPFTPRRTEGMTRENINTENTISRRIADLDFINHSLLLLNIERRLPEDAFSGITNKVQASKGLDYLIRFSSGISTWDFGYGSTDPIRKEYEKSRLSFTAQVNYQHFIHKRYFLITGLVYQQLESRLDWSDNIDDYRVALEGVVIGTKTNALTGETEEVRGDVEVGVEAERIVRHHNRHTLIQLPLGMGMQHQFGALNWFIQTGASVNIRGHSTGRILQPDNVYNYDGTSNKFYQNSWAINGFVETGLGLPLNHAWNLNAAIGYQKAWSNWSLENGVQMRPQIFSLQLGLAYQIK